MGESATLKTRRFLTALQWSQSLVPISKKIHKNLYSGRVALFSPAADKDSKPYHHMFPDVWHAKYHATKLRHWINSKDWYMSLATFKGNHRTIRNIRSLPGLIVDVDCKENHKERKHIRTTWQEVFARRKELLLKSKLQEPTAILMSGHGLYFIWLFKEPLMVNSLTILEIWERIEKRLNIAFNKGCKALFGELLADSKHCDPNHVYRIPLTWNHKESTPVQCKVLSINPKRKTVWKYWSYNRFHAPKPKLTHKQYLANGRKYHQIWLDKHNSSRINNKANNHYIRGKHHHSALTYQLNLIQDLYQYLDARHYNLDSNKREPLLFIYAITELRIDHPQGTNHSKKWAEMDVIKRINTLNKRLTNPLPAYVMDDLARQIKSNKIKDKKTHQYKSFWNYRFSKSKIKTYLGISNKEAKSMRVLCPNSHLIALKLASKRKTTRNKKITHDYRYRHLNKSQLARKYHITRHTINRVLN